jgi:hypothetical protein
LQFKDATIRQRIENGCNAVIQVEPKITEYDTTIGDGDCGLTLRDGARKVVDFIKDKDLLQLAFVVSTLVDDPEVTMDGTSGALYCIYLASFSQSTTEVGYCGRSNEWRDAGADGLYEGEKGRQDVSRLFGSVYRNSE